MRDTQENETHRLETQITEDLMQKPGSTALRSLLFQQRSCAFDVLQPRAGAGSRLRLKVDEHDGCTDRNLRGCQRAIAGKQKSETLQRPHVPHAGFCLDGGIADCRAIAKHGCGPDGALDGRRRPRGEELGKLVQPYP